MLKNNNKYPLYLFAGFFVLYEFSTYVANDMIMPGMVKVIQEFGVSADYIALGLILYILGNAILTPLIGPFAERYGNRRVILAGALVFLITTILLAFSKNISQFCIFRVLEGFGLAVIAPGYTLIHKNFNDTEALKLTALMSNIAIMAPLIGPMFGAMIINYYDWRVVFYIIEVFSLIVIIGLVIYIPKTPQLDLIKSINIRNTLIEYKKVIKSKSFIIGVTILSLSALSFIEWIGLGPAILIYKMHKSYLTYALYQIIAIGGISISSILLQFIGGRIHFQRILLIGYISVIVAIVINVGALIVPFKLDFMACGFLVFGFGNGLVGGVVMRLLMTDKSSSQNYMMPTLVFIQLIAMIVVLELLNHLIAFFDYSLNCLSVVNIISWGLICYLLGLFKKMHKNHEWQ